MLPPPDALPDSAPRLANDRYVLLARVGKGGMAGVYAAWDVREQDWRAIKVLLPRLARDQAIRTRFANEGVTMARLAHPNLVRVYDIGTAAVTDGPELPFIVMELLNGGSLHRWVKTHGKMPARLAVTAAVQLLQGLEAVHAAGVVHRDVKPKNVLADDASVLKLTDFGIAQLEASGDTKTGLAMGTLGYMAPEQLHDAKSVDPRSDLYAVAASLWTLLTTQKPRDLFRLEDRPELMTAVPEPLRPVLSRCLAYERSDRPASARVVADELRALLFSLPEDPPGTPDLSLHLGMPDTRGVGPESFTELSLTSNGAFMGAVGTQSDAFSGRLPVAVDRTDPPHADGGRRLGHRAPEPAPREAPREPSYVVDTGPAPRGYQDVEEPAPASYTELRRASDASVAAPAYLAEPEERPNPLPPPPRPSAVPVAASALGGLSAMALLVVGAVFLLGVALAGWLGNLAVDLRAAEGRFEASSAELDRQVGYLDTLPDELAAIGVESTDLRATWEQWRSAEASVARSELAIAWLREAEARSAAAVPDKDRTHEQELVRQRFDLVRKPLDQTQFDLREWRAASEGPVAEVVTGLGLARSPSGAP
jgi:serine/threonine protein kinase